MKDLCSSCNKFPVINRKHMLCQICNHKRLHPNEPKKIYKPIRKILRKNKAFNRDQESIKKQKQSQKAIRKITDKQKLIRLQDKKIFLEIWSEREHICVCCNQELLFPNTWYFSHVVSKGALPQARHDKENIVLKCDKCHFEWEHGDRNKLFNKEILFELAFYIKNKYSCQK